MDLNIKPDFLKIQLVVNNVIVGLMQSCEITQFGINNHLIFGEAPRIMFYKKHCNPFPKFFELQFVENSKLIYSFYDVYLQNVINVSPENLEKLIFSGTYYSTSEMIIFEDNLEHLKFSNKDSNFLKEDSNFLKEDYSKADREYQQKKKQIFTDEFKKELDIGKYTSWVNKLSPEQLRELFWMIGEVKIRSGRVFDESKINEICRGLDVDKIQGSTERTAVGLCLLLEFLSGKERTLDEVREEIRKI